ncbi:nuclear receptor subfamily 5 group A member 2-like [Tubulanus polymorphus]|uniref:nuclear receptor subfamily 5 group A member 2-like n=1 Tax=Tubulanus polymorphus TaxID=672921 RepID=UPI003DA5773D
MEHIDNSAAMRQRTDLTPTSQVLIDIGSSRHCHLDFVARNLHGQNYSPATSVAPPGEIGRRTQQQQQQGIRLKQQHSLSISEENISSSPEPIDSAERPNSVKPNIPPTTPSSIDLASPNFAAAAMNAKLIKSEQRHEDCSSASDFLLHYPSERSGQRTPAPLDLGKTSSGGVTNTSNDLLSPVRSEAGDHRHGDQLTSPINQNGPKFPDVYFMDSQFTPNEKNSPKSPVSAENEDPSLSSSDVKFGIEECCPVCGDKVSGYHYGLLTCESCKGFFKRTVQNKKVYSCVDNRSCQIDKTQRKRCPYCRFQKCLQVGMKLEAVRADRMRGGRNKFGPMYKRDRAIKQQALRQQQQLLQQYQHQLQQIQQQGNSSGSNGNNVERDIKPDITLLQQHQHSLNTSAGQVNGMDLSQDASSNNSSANNTSNNPALFNPAMYTNSLPQTSFPGLLNPLQNIPQLVPSSLRIVPPLISDLKSHELDENEIQQKIIALAQYQLMSTEPRSKQEIVLGMCKLADHCLFMLVEWARGALFFKELKVEDQMKLLQSCWSELLIIEYISRLVKLRNSQSPLRHDVSHLEFLVKIGLPDVKTRLLELGRNFDELKADIYEYTCLKFLILLNPDVIGLEERQFIEQSQEKINAALLEYCIRFYPDMKDKFGQLLLRLPEIRVISLRVEEFLYSKHVNGEVLGQTLLLEMLHSKRK